MWIDSEAVAMRMTTGSDWCESLTLFADCTHHLTEATGHPWTVTSAGLRACPAATTEGSSSTASRTGGSRRTRSGCPASRPPNARPPASGRSPQHVASLGSRGDRVKGLCDQLGRELRR
ncbi:hypothetical protein DEJ46_27280 [Streptomyces venezuelae]|uniref:Uncharacterized protein n=1 Tax=Streptomyces venezuelae TaxID=54571 RepID=A0A5P2AW07_STRVZ|nr:hypothetical protein DEJ46_27280 [Streptomyces venezuelae]